MKQLCLIVDSFLCEATWVEIQQCSAGQKTMTVALWGRYFSIEFTLEVSFLQKNEWCSCVRAVASHEQVTTQKWGRKEEVTGRKGNFLLVGTWLKN